MEWLGLWVMLGFKLLWGKERIGIMVCWEVMWRGVCKELLVVLVVRVI